MMPRMHFGLGFLAIVCFLALASPLRVSAAESGSAALQGTVRSDGEAAMGGVLVSATKAGSTITTTVVTDEKGHYAFPAARLTPGKYNIAIRAVGYRLNAPQATEVTGVTAASADIALKKVTDLHQLADQLTNGDWRSGMPGDGFGCA